MNLETIKGRLTEVKQFLLTNNGNLESLEERLNGVKSEDESMTKDSPKPDNGIIGDISEQVEVLYNMLSAQKEIISKLNSTVYSQNLKKCEYSPVTQQVSSNRGGSYVG